MKKAIVSAATPSNKRHQIPSDDTKWWWRHKHLLRMTRQHYCYLRHPSQASVGHTAAVQQASFHTYKHSDKQASLLGLAYNHVDIIATRAALRSEGGIVFSSVRLCVCLFVYLSVCQHDNYWTARDIITKFPGIIMWSKERPSSTRKPSWHKGYARQCRHLSNAFKVRQRKFRRKNSNLQPFKVIQGHRPWCQSKAHMHLVINTCSNFGRISYRFRDIDA